jgi:hypothetical protein
MCWRCVGCLHAVSSACCHVFGSVIVQVGGEETIAEIQDRYLAYNRHALSYTWKVGVSLRFVS